ncbi:GTPase Der [termite gut metagenome]|uniref:GTPase Der n=1 Tax=termite gut metagenome TaxID=433724 RepID=A0A5J4RT61_9ZZZZ
MKDATQLQEISEALELQEISDKLSFIQERQRHSNKELIIPLVGEYSSGKTSLLNSLTNGKKLETAILPTTATIFEVRFANITEKAEIFYEDSTMREVEDISSLKNSDLVNAQLVKIYDSSVKIPSSTVLVDTPGLSSLNPKHQKALAGYLPLADVILMVVDVNQGVTASVLKFIDMVGLARKRIYITITMCDTKPESEREQVKRYIRDNIKVPIEKIVCVSARKEEVHELVDLIAEIQKDKNQIVAEITALRLDAIRKELLNYVDELLNSSKLSTGELDQKILATKRNVQETQSKIDRLISDLARKIEILSADTINDFNRKIAAELDGIAKNPPKGCNINQVTIAKIESISHLYFENFKSDVIKELTKLVKERKNSTEDIHLPSLETLDLSDYALTSLSYNIDLELPELQKMNKRIATGIKVVAVAAVTAVGVAGAAIAASAAGIAKSVGKLIDVADTATDVASIASNANHIKKITKIQNGIATGTKYLSSVDESDNQIGQQISGMQEESKGAVERLVGFFTEHTHVRPQRKRLIDDFILGSLQPEFKQKMEYIGESIVSSINHTLSSESENKMNQLKEGLEKLHLEKESEKELYVQKVNVLQTYKKSLEE